MYVMKEIVIGIMPSTKIQFGIGPTKKKKIKNPNQGITYDITFSKRQFHIIFGSISSREREREVKDTCSKTYDRTLRGELLRGLRASHHDP